MRRKKSPEEFNETQSVNALMTNFMNMVKLDPERNNASFLDYCITRLYEKHGQTKRFIMCRLLMRGLETDPLYSNDIEELRKEFDMKINV